MYEALPSGEMLPTVEVNWYRTSVEGKQEHFFTTKLEDASILDINITRPHAPTGIAWPLRLASSIASSTVKTCIS